MKQRFLRRSCAVVQFATVDGIMVCAADLRGWRCSHLLPVYPDGGSSVLRFYQDAKFSSHVRGADLSNLISLKTVKSGLITATPIVGQIYRCRLLMRTRFQTRHSS